MALALCLTLLPTAAWAEETDAPEDGTIVQEEQQEEAPAAESPAILEQAADNGIAVQDGGSLLVYSGSRGTKHSSFDAAFQDAINKENAAIWLDSDVSTSTSAGTSFSCTSGKITINLKGHTLTYTGTDDYFLSVNGGTLEIEGTGSIVSAKGTLHVQNGTLTISKGTGTLIGTNGNALRVDGGSVTLKGGTFRTNATDGCSIWVDSGNPGDLLGQDLAYVNADDGQPTEYDTTGKGVKGSVTVTTLPNSVQYLDAKGNTKTAFYTPVTATTKTLATGWYAVTENITLDSLTVSGAANLILCDEISLAVSNALTVASGGELNLYFQESGTGKLTAGTVSSGSAVTAPAGEMKTTTTGSTTTYEKCLNHQWRNTSGTGGDTVTKTCDLCGTTDMGGAVAKLNNGDVYTTLAAAITAAAAAENSTVQLLNDVTTTGTIRVASGTFTLDLNGKTWNGTADDTLQVDSGGNVTVTSTNGVGTITCSQNNAICVGHGATVHVKSGVRLNQLYAMTDAKLTLDVGVIITGTFFTNAENIAPFLTGKALQKCDENDKLIDGHYVSIYKNYGGTDDTGRVIVIEHTSHEGTPSAENPCKICGYSGTQTEPAKPGNPNPDVAEVNGQKYKTLAAAIKAANGADITLLTIVSENVVVNDNSKAGVILGNGATINDIPYPSNWVADRNGIPLTMEAGEITLKDGALAQFSGDANANNAIALKGGTLTVEDTVTKIIGSVASEYAQRASINATGGVLDLQGNTLLDGGLTMSGDAQLKNKLTAGTFTNSGSETSSVSVEGSNRYKTVFDLLETGYAFAKYDESAENKAGTLVNGNVKQLTEDVVVVAHQHSVERIENPNQDSFRRYIFRCNCGFVCPHDKFTNSICNICHTACTHDEDDGFGSCAYCGAPFEVRVEHTDNVGITSNELYMKITAQDGTDNTLQQVFNKAKDGSTITLLVDGLCASGAVTDRTITLDLNGKSLIETSNGIRVDPNSTLKVTGSGSIAANISVGAKGTLDLSGWTGGTINTVGLSNNGTDESTLTVGENAGTIGGLEILNWPSERIAKTKLRGGSYNKILITMKSGTGADKTIPYSSMLAEGYAFQYVDSKEFVDYAAAAQYSNGDGSISNVKVVKCPHAKINEDGRCAYCNAAGFVAQVTAADGSSSAYTDIAAAIVAADGGTVKLLANADEITISSPLKLDLNGKTAAKLTVTGDVTLASLLPEGCAFKSGSTWITDLIGTELTNVSMAKIPIKSMNYPTEMSMTYGGAGTLLVTVAKETGTGAVNFQWYKVEDGKETAVGGATTSNQFDLSTQRLSAGQHTFRFSATCDGYEKMSQDIVVTVQRANISASIITSPTARENLTYTGQEQALITAGSVTSGGTMQYSLTENGTYSETIPTGTNAGAYTVWYRAIGDENHNDTTPASVAVRIGKKPLTINGVTAASKTYDGTTNADISSVKFDNVTLNRGTDYTVTASFDDASAGNVKNITATVTLMEQTAKNYALEQSSFNTTGNITKAAAPDFTKETALVIVNGLEKTYTVTLPTLPTLETPKEYGAPTYELGEIKLNDGYYTSGAKVENGALTLPIQKNDVKTTGSVGTVTVVIKSANYEDITLTVNVNATNKLIPTVTAPTANALTYNGSEQALVTAGKTTGGTMLYRLGDSKWSEQIPTAKNAGEYTVWYKVQGNAEYADVAEQNVTVTAAKKAVTVTALNQSAYTGSTAPDLSSPKADKDYKVEGLVGADTLSGTVTLTYEQTLDMSKTGKTAINITGTLSNDNYEITYVHGTLTVSDRPSSGGGGSSSDRDTSSSGTVKTETTKNNDGSVTKTETKKDGTKVETTTGKDGSVSKTTTNPNGSSVTETKAADGSTGTVKTDKNGQTTAETKVSAKAVEDAKKNGEAVKAPVEVKATRDSSTAPTVKVELPKNSGDTKVKIPVSNVKPGTVAVLVHPDGTEEIVKNSLPTEDGIQLTVNGGATVKIVDNSKDFIDTRNHWAKDAIDFVSARGLVNGMSATIYAPNASTTRAQLWTILARQNNADLTGGATWFENAQNWAKEKGISDGTNPNGTINRAQMVTMLWRAMGQPAAAASASFADVPADSYYAQAVAWAIENGITAGVGGGRFDPNSTCTRAQIATFLARSMK